MERITQENLDRRVENLNSRMEERGSVIRYQWQMRSGQCALDRVRRDPDATINLPNSVPGRGYGWITMNLVRVGTKGEIGEFLHAMMTALDDAAQTD